MLQDVSFVVKSGQAVGLVGPSGSGKTTIANLIARFYDPAQGKITLDGKDLRDVQLAALRRNIGYVSQETILFNATIKENIRLGKLDATDEEIEQAARLANIHDFIAKLRKGYNTIVGERGVNLSGGQKQRISIARTILKNPKIIVLDEATSSLDSESEEKIQEALEYATRGKTTIIIAHRLSTIKNVDKIVFLQDGVVAEQGTFTKLLERHGFFYQFYHTQARGLNNFKEQLSAEWKRTHESGKPLSLIMLNITNFERILQTMKRDEALSLITRIEAIIEADLRPIDFMTKVPRSQFSYYIVMPEIGIDAAEHKTKQLIEKVMKHVQGPVFGYQVISGPEQIHEIMK